MIEYVNPEGQSSIENTPYRLSASIKGANAIKIGFLANGFPDSENFLALLADELSELEPGIEKNFTIKGTPLSRRVPSSCQASRPIVRRL